MKKAKALESPAFVTAWLAYAYAKAGDRPRAIAELERVGDVCRDRKRFIEGNPAARDPLRQILAVDELHRAREMPSLSSNP